MRYGDYLRVLERFQTPWLAPFTTEMPAEETVCTSSQYKRHLQSKGVHFEIVKHAKAYTASEVAAEAKVSGHKLAKTVRHPVDWPAGSSYFASEHVCAARLPASKHSDGQAPACASMPGQLTLVSGTDSL